MDPLTIGLQAVGIGLQLFGGMSAADHASQAAQISKNIAGDEQKINSQKYQQYQLETQRMQMQQFRNMQRLRAQATAAAVNQGASKGSGLQGGLAQITDQTLGNSLAINQNSEIAGNIFGLNQDISQQKMQMADVKASMAQDQALASLGGAMTKNAGTIGNIASVGGKSIENAFALFKPGSLSGGYA